LAGAFIGLFIWLAFQTPPQTLHSMERQKDKKREGSRAESSDADAS
jgi:hypothetical protein